MKKYYILLASLVLAVFGLAQLGEAQSSPSITVTESDGSPRVVGVSKIVVSNGTLTASGKTATISTGGGGGGSVNVNGASVSSPNFNGTTPAAPAGGINTTWQVSGSSVSGYLDLGSFARAYVREPITYSDLITANDIIGTAAIASGTLTSNLNSIAEHPGIISVTSSTSSNSGASIRFGTDKLLIFGGERADIIFQTPASITNTTIRLGFHDAASSADATDGAYFELPGTLDLVGKTANNSTRTTSSTIATLSNSTWYHAVIQINSNATSVDFTLYSEAGASLGTQSITTNIPTGAGRYCTIGFIATNSATTAVGLGAVDYISLAYTRALVRGQ